MRTSIFRAATVLLAVCACLAALGPSSFSADWVSLGAERAGGSAPLDAGSLAVAIVPREVFEAGLVTLSVLQDGVPLGREWRVAWKADGGTFHSDDLVEVDWRAPVSATSVEVRAEVVPAGDSRGERYVVRRKVEVRAPSTDGMVWIPAGTFVMGDLTNSYDAGEVKTIQNSGDEPPHSVTLDDFWIDRCPVTNEDYRAFLQAGVEQGLVRVNPVAVMGRFEGSEVPFYYFQSFEKLIPESVRGKVGRRPTFRHSLRYDGDGRFEIETGQELFSVVDVTWFGAAAYAACQGKKLPTEAQWEKAARGTDGRRFPWGTNVPTAYHVALASGRRGDPRPVGSFSPAGDSPYGVADMVSGIFEWTGDWFNPYHYADTSMETPTPNPQGPFWGRAHTIRGVPQILSYPTASLESLEPVSSRYSWHFEFFLGDSFANAETGFRTVLVPRKSQ